MTPEKQERCFTILVIPHSEEATFSLRFSISAVKFAVIIAVLIISGFGFLGYSYLMVSAEANRVEELRQINRAQKEEIDALAIETEKAMNQINELDQLIEKVTEKIDNVEILEDIENLQDKIKENRAKPLLSGSTNPHHESISVVYFNGPVPQPHTYGLDPRQTQANLTGFTPLYESSSNSNMVLGRAVENIATMQSVIPEQLDTLDEVENYIGKIEAKLEQMEAKPSLWPARGRITSGFGTRNVPYSGGYQFHTGVDIAGSHGSNIRAAASGKVTFSGYRGSLGNLIIIDHGYGYETYYAHLSGFAINKGDEVGKGQTIGYMGASGRTTGTHLHYEVHYKGSPVNPVRYMVEH